MNLTFAIDSCIWKVVMVSAKTVASAKQGQCQWVHLVIAHLINGYIIAKLLLCFVVLVFDLSGHMIVSHCRSNSTSCRKPAPWSKANCCERHCYSLGKTCSANLLFMQCRTGKSLDAILSHLPSKLPFWGALQNGNHVLPPQWPPSSLSQFEMWYCRQGHVLLLAVVKYQHLLLYHCSAVGAVVLFFQLNQCCAYLCNALICL